jgi:hypothetical protein
MRKAIALLALVQTTSASAAEPGPCVQRIQQWRDASDCQHTETIPTLTWADGFTKWPASEKGKWSDIQMNGPCPKYSTTLREWRPGPVRGNRQVVHVKSISKRVDLDGRFSGYFTVSKNKYTCERRAREWKIFSKEVTHSTDLTNRAVNDQFRKTGGW